MALICVKDLSEALHQFPSNCSTCKKIAVKNSKRESTNIFPTSQSPLDFEIEKKPKMRVDVKINILSFFFGKRETITWLRMALQILTQCLKKN